MEKRPAYYPPRDRAPGAQDPTCRIWGHDPRRIEGRIKCFWCAGHYGDSGRCDEGKPVASPHRAALAKAGV